MIADASVLFLWINEPVDPHYFHSLSHHLLRSIHFEQLIILDSIYINANHSAVFQISNTTTISNITIPALPSPHSITGLGASIFTTV